MWKEKATRRSIKEEVEGEIKNWFQFVAVRVVPGSEGRQAGLVPL